MKIRLFFQIGTFLLAGITFLQPAAAQSIQDGFDNLHRDWGTAEQQRAPFLGNNTPAPAVPVGPTPMQQMQLQGAQMLGTALGQMLFASPQQQISPQQLAAQQAAQLAAQQAQLEAQRRAQQEAERSRQLKLAAQQLNSSGIYLFKQRNYAGAINEFQQALAKTPGDPDILHNLAVAKHNLANTTVAAQNSGALRQLLGDTPADDGKIDFDRLTHAQAPSPNDSALNLVNLDSNPNVVDLRGTTKTYVDPALVSGDLASKPADAQQALKDLNNLLDNNADQVKKQLDDFANNYLPHNTDGNSANSASGEPPQIHNQRVDAEQNAKAFDQAMAQPVDESKPVEATQLVAKPQSVGQFVAEVQSEGLKDAPTDNQSGQKVVNLSGVASADAGLTPVTSSSASSSAPDIKATDQLVSAAASGQNSGPYFDTGGGYAGSLNHSGSSSTVDLSGTTPIAANNALMKNQWQMSIDSRYLNDPEVQQSIRDLWAARRSGDKAKITEADNKIASTLTDQLKIQGWTSQQISIFFANLKVFKEDNGLLPKQWNYSSPLARQIDAQGAVSNTNRYNEIMFTNPLIWTHSIKADASYMSSDNQKANDCVLYAIANGAQVNVEQVKSAFYAAAKDLGIEPVEARNNPRLITTAQASGGIGGLSDIEELLAAGKVGTVIAVPSDKFAQVIEDSHQPIVTTVKNDYGYHEVVVTGAYVTADGNAYYSVMDSNFKGVANHTAYVDKQWFEGRMASEGGIVVTRFHQKMKSLILSFVFIQAIAFPSLAQLTNTQAADSNIVAANQAPDGVMQKLSRLVHDGKYAEAQQLAAGLLLAYPDDQHLIKAKTLLDRLNATAKQPDIAPDATEVNVNSVQITGMDKVDYNALIQRAREAQQTTDLAQQTTLLNQFMADSSEFLQKHPDQILIWQLRAASAISLNNLLAGYEAGQKLLALGAADSNDSNLQQLLVQLKNKGWLDKNKIEAEKKQKALEKQYDWLLGTWDVSWSLKTQDLSGSRGEEEFQMVNSTVNGFEMDNSVRKNGVIDESGGKIAIADMRGTILDSGEIKWECFLPASDPHGLFTIRFPKDRAGNGFLDCGFWLTSCCWHGFESQLEEKFQSATNTVSLANPTELGAVSEYVATVSTWRDNILKLEYYPSGWLPVISCTTSNNMMTILIPSQSYDPASKKHYSKPVTLVFIKNSAQQNQSQK